MQIVHVVEQQSRPVHRPDLRDGLLHAGAVGHHRVTNLIGDTDPGGTGAEDDHVLVLHRDAGDADSPVECGHHHCAGALDVVIENAVIRGIFVQNGPRVGGPKVFEMQHCLRKQLMSGLDILRDERVVLASTSAGMAFTQVTRVLQQLFVVSSDVE